MPKSKGRVAVVAGAQFGSEAKGAVAAFLSKEYQGSGQVMGVRVGGPNAGHTVYGKCPPSCDPDGGADHEFGADTHPWRLRQVPVLAVSREDAKLVIAAGSEVDMTVLLQEVRDLDDAGYQVSGRLYVDASCTMIQSHHKTFEEQSGLVKNIGSTGKGIGAARSDRIMRKAMLVKDFTGLPIPLLQTAPAINQWLSDGAYVIVEGTQGYGLGLHTNYYPQVTSGDCRAIDFLAQAGISPWDPNIERTDVWLVARTRPIRVAGNSGPLYKETTWEELGLPEEKTTVTQKVRRVGEWDFRLVNEAIEANGGPGPNLHLVVTMVDHIIPEVAGTTTIGTAWESRVHAFLDTLHKELDAPIELIGTGPRTMAWIGDVAKATARAEVPNVTFMGDAFQDALRKATDTILTEGAKERLAALEDVTGTLSGVVSIDTLARSRAPRPTWIYELPGKVKEMPELVEWWMDIAHKEAQDAQTKSDEYGGRGKAVDLIELGHQLAMNMGIEDLFDSEKIELGIYFYVQGKIARWSAAIREGRRVSDDTLKDLSTYVRMVQRTRAVGNWPNAVTE